MATPASELKKLQKQVGELQKLERQVAQLQKRVAQLEARKRVSSSAARKPTHPPKTNQEIIALLKNAGIIRDLTPEEKQMGAAWRALSPQEQAQVNQALANIRLDQTVTELVAKVRA
ncbi:MAG: hypothetical protein HDKAJFGB_02813 [Anaerolineae bacterium]|nr:hypothetical protein [Anaerolineae bacterium]